MTPHPEFVDAGVLYLGLGMEEERYLAPYFWKFPSIMFLDFEHNQRSAMRQLKYDTLDITMHKDKYTINVTMDHLANLRSECEKKNVSCEL